MPRFDEKYDLLLDLLADLLIEDLNEEEQEQSTALLEEKMPIYGRSQNSPRPGTNITI
jgi:hypothetical protein